MSGNHVHLNKKINQYYLVKFLGKGQFGEVYLALNEKDDENYAVKVMNKKMINSNEKLRQLFHAELNIMRKLRGNRHIVQLHDFVETGNNYYVVLEYCNQKDLTYVMKENKLLESEALNYLEQILEGFRSLHEKNIMHRDFKADNIFISDGVCKIGDFGFAKQLGMAGIATTTLGTPLTMAPEVLEKKQYDNKADIWSLGVVYYQMLYGKYPFMAKSEYQLIQNLKNQKPKFDSSVSQLSNDFIDKCLQYDPKKRIQWSQVYEHPLF